MTSSDDGGLTPPHFTSFEWNPPLDTDGGPNDAQSEIGLFDPEPFNPSVDMQSDETPSFEACPPLNNPEPGGSSKHSRCFPTLQTTEGQTSEKPPLRRRKKPNGMPKRPLTAYNIFFQRERTKLMGGPGGTERIGFVELGKVIGQRWRDLPESELKIVKKLAEEDRERYRQEMQAYNEGKHKKARVPKESQHPLAAKDDAVAPPGKIFEEGMRRIGSSSRLPESPILQNSACTDSSSPRSETRTPDPRSEPSFQGAQYQVPFLNIEHNPPYSVYPRHGDHSPSPTVSRAPYSPRSRSSGPFSFQPQNNAPFFSPPHAPHSGPPLPPPELPRIHPGGPHYPPNSFPIPPGWQFTLPDAEGVLRKYRVQYAAVAMTSEEAKNYLEQMAGVPLSAMATDRSARFPDAARRNERQWS